MTIRTPHQHLIELRPDDLRPTQITVGMAEVEAKRAEWRALKRKERQRRLASHWFPCVLGPRGRPYIVDHHHLGLALQREGVERCFGIVLQDYAWLDAITFWRTMEFHQWAHPYDERGARRVADDIPKRLDDLRDDAYRSLVGFVREAGGFSKDSTPYAEFLWADFFRARLPHARVAGETAGVLSDAIALALSPDARYLPGWTGAAGPSGATRGRT